MNKKVAVCLCGEPRMIKYSSIAIKKFFERLNVDYFVFSWQENTTLIPTDYINYTQQEIEEKNIIKNKDKLKKYISELYKPKSIAIENNTFERKYGQFIAFQRSVEMTKPYKEEYSAIVRIRFDTPCAWLYENKNLFTDLEQDRSAIYVNNVRVDPFGKFNIMSISDHGLFFGEPEVMYEYTKNIYEKLQTYFKYQEEYKKIDCNTVPHSFFYRATIAEHIWYILFCMSDIKPKKYSTLTHSIARPGTPILSENVDTLEKQKDYVSKSVNYLRWWEIMRKVDQGSLNKNLLSDWIKYYPKQDYDAILNHISNNIKKYK